MNVSRRRLFGFGAALLAAPALVRVASLMPISVPKFIVPPPLDLSDFSTDNLIITVTERYRMNYEAFRAILMPGLREHFDGVYDQLEWPSS